MQKRESGSIAAALTERAGQGADAVQVAAAFASLWEEIDTSLRPIIGQQGVAALLKRSVNLASRMHRWLNIPQEGMEGAADLVSLKAAISQQTDVQLATAGCIDTLQTFYVLLSTLIGSSLTDRLLRGVWTPLPSALPDQDTPSS